ncbi:hypothetical protein MMC07_009189 [Pseudocyphellaria aurata]|nr:hypothetical protein [Pseudocyphellaria aurata]
MGKKKRGHPDIEEQLARPWCYYCERDFDDLKILINHQKAKHFKCERCGRRLNTAGGLSVHMTQVHKETLTTIENALPNRSGLDVEIFGMEGIPEDIVSSHNQRVIAQFAQAEAERRAATGNPGPGGAGGSGVKKPKFESPSDLKKRLAEHKAKKAAEQNAGYGSGDNTPNGAGQGNQSPGLGQSPVGFTASPAYVQPPMQYGGPPNNSTYSSFPQPYGQTPAPYSQQPTPFAQQPPAFSSSGMPPGFSNSQPYVPPQQYQPPGGQPFPLPYQNGPPQPYNSGSPPAPFQHSQYQPPRTHTPPQNGPPPRSGNLPPAPGLPQRPSFGAPPVNAFQMQQMHQGQLPGLSPSPDSAFNHQPGSSQQFGRPLGSPPNGNAGGTNGSIPPHIPGEHVNANSANATSLDDLLSGAAKDADRAESSMSVKAELKVEDPQEDKKSRKDKDKNTKLVYSDNDVSPEEKMAQLPRYAFVPGGKDSGILGVATTAAVTVSST